MDAFFRPILNGLQRVTVHAIGHDNETLILIELLFFQGRLKSKVLLVTRTQGALQTLLALDHRLQLGIGVATEFLPITHDLK
ncbi:hypothetical protein D3C81_2163230 [compost metagenome]